jgi:polyphosphate glucokinase
MRILGIDVGATGIKGAVVDLTTGALVTRRHRVRTPDPSTPAAVARVTGALVRRLGWKGKIGIGMPGPIKEGRVMTAINMHRTWIGTEAVPLYEGATGCRVKVLNDADAAGLAEMRFGAGRGKKGIVIVLTLGTGIGSSLFVDGRLVPNIEFGQIEIRGKTGEQRAAARVRKERELTWEQWGKRLDEYLGRLEELTWPDLMILGGGASRKAEKFLPLLHTRAGIVPARFRNEAGIIGAAIYGA